MRQIEAVDQITKSLQEDERVKAVFLKGSMGRKEDDEHSDVDLYCLVAEDEVQEFLKDRKRHVEAYRDVIFYDDIFIIAPQIIAVYDNLLHLDLFTVTEDTLIHKDYFRVIYDPEGRMEKYKDKQHLQLSEQDFIDAVDDAAFFLLQYKKAADRGNDIWAVKVLNDLLINLAQILLQRYSPDRAQLGLKTLDRTLPEEITDRIRHIYLKTTPDEHPEAILIFTAVLSDQEHWIEKNLPKLEYTLPFLKRMIKEFQKK
ncbi:aminoglycoside 6-adenylyltransferase [Halobacillus mangrovi]|uniref:DNA polymerase III subunit beta n=1 Tax=Halobacillus mangrovi TaxID=402384 RepID=A0A1W5ZYJ3_9BACI|nr:aminoglycoside 6-adenylyltransferase [Halobacillus mangrovi]ARI78426.1 DNA polymerase III subunit beta [Halobacillus mangrovi]